MTAKLISPEATGATVTTTTVYTVPASKSARVRLAWQVRANASNPTGFIVKVGALTIYSATIPAGQYCYTAAYLDSPNQVVPRISADPPYSPGGGIPAAVVAPMSIDQILATTQTITYQITTNAAQSVAFKVMGVEDDAV